MLKETKHNARAAVQATEQLQPKTVEEAKRVPAQAHYLFQ